MFKMKNVVAEGSGNNRGAPQRVVDRKEGRQENVPEVLQGCPDDILPRCIHTKDGTRDHIFLVEPLVQPDRMRGGRVGGS